MSITRDELIEDYACPRMGCKAPRGLSCRRANGEPRTQQHSERWEAAGVSLDDLRHAAYRRNAC